jgi:hypothetical protein
MSWFLKISFSLSLDEEIRKEIQSYREAVENQVVDRTKPIECNYVASFFDFLLLSIVTIFIANDVVENVSKKRAIGDDLMPHEHKDLFAVVKPL